MSLRAASDRRSRLAPKGVTLLLLVALAVSARGRCSALDLAFPGLAPSTSAGEFAGSRLFAQRPVQRAFARHQTVRPPTSNAAARLLTISRQPLAPIAVPVALALAPRALPLREALLSLPPPAVG